MSVEISEEKCLSKQDWIVQMSQKAQEMKQQPKKMQKVPWLLKSKDGKEFEPSLVSIGPYHHGNDECKAMQKLKPLVAEQFLDRKTIADVFDTFESRVKNERLMEYYELDESQNRSDPDDFIRMMFLDGCFILRFINGYVQDNLQGELQTYKDFLKQDLLLLENQLPFIVLEMLLSIVNESEKQGRLRVIKKFIRDNSGAISPPNTKWCYGDGFPDGDRPLHLLHLLWAQLIHSEAVTVGSVFDQLVASEITSASEEPRSSAAKPRQRSRYLVRGAKELRGVGIKVEPSSESTLKQVNFTSYNFYSYLSLPPMVVDDTSKTNFLNLIAYEMGQDQRTGQTVASYVCFMDSLIDSAEDVKELRQSRVLNNFLASDEAAADLFNNLAHDLVPGQVYATVERKIQEHYERTYTTWVAEVINNHFSSPWTCVAFFAAIFTILLTLTQTYFAIFPRSPPESSHPSPQPPVKLPPRKLFG